MDRTLSVNVEPNLMDVAAAGQQLETEGGHITCQESVAAIEHILSSHTILQQRDRVPEIWNKCNILYDETSQPGKETTQNKEFGFEST